MISKSNFYYNYFSNLNKFNYLDFDEKINFKYLLLFFIID